MAFTWPLVTPILPAPGAVPSTSYLAPGNGIATCVPLYLTEADLLAVLDRILPDWYLEPIKDPGPGYELFQSFAAALERASIAVGRFECSTFILFSHGGSRALASVEFYRSSASAGAFTIKAGTLCRTSSSSRTFTLLADVVFGASDLFVDGQVQAVAPGAEYNVPGPFSTADATVLAGDIDQIICPILDPTFAEPTIQVRQIADATGGQAAVLDQLGLDRNLPRFPGETDETFKTRIRTLPETISPDALWIQLASVFYPRDLRFELIETWQNQYNSCWNAPIGGPVDPVFGPLVELAYNDPRTDRFVPRWMSERDHRGAIAVIVPTFPAFDDRGMAYNDPALTGLPDRGTSAWSAPAIDTPASLAGVWNGEDDDSAESRAAFLRNTWNMLAQVKGGGIAVAFFPAEVDQVLP